MSTKGHILLVDNYDSFTYNLAHALKKLGATVDVIRNDKIDLLSVADYDAILLSPGPGLPDEAGQLKEIISMYAESKPMLGICLGHQAIAEVFGGKLRNLDRVYHGVSGNIIKTQEVDVLLASMPQEFDAARYHSWVVEPDLPSALVVTATNEEGIVMAIRHTILPIHGLQFHPESVLTPLGETLLSDWLTEIADHKKNETQTVPIKLR